MANYMRKRLWFWGGLCMLLIMTATALAEKPNLVGAFLVNGRVGLKWQEISGTAEYFIYRKAGDGDFEKIDSIEKARYFDIDITPGTVYAYKISVIGVDGKELFSNEKSVNIPAEQAGEFNPPIWVGLRIDREKVFLNWDDIPGAIAYNIYRSATSGSGYEVVGNSQASKYADKTGMEKGKTYYYVLTALNDDFDETEYSEEKSIKYGVSKEEMDALLAEQNKIELEETKLTLLFDIKEAGAEGAMNQPADVFLNSENNIYVTDALNGKVHCFDPNGKHLFSFGELMVKSEANDPPPGAFAIPFTLFIDNKDQVFVSDIDSHDIQVFTADGKFIKRIKVDVGEGMAELRPNGIYVLDDGRIITTDTGNHRILIIDQNGKILKSRGEKGADPGQFVFPDGLTVSNNEIYVVDVINNRVQVLDLELNFLRAFGHVGQEAGAFARPKEITADEKGRIWVSDGMSHMIQCFTPEGEVKSVISSAVDETLNISSPRGLFFKDGKFYIVNRLPHTVSVYKIG